MNPIIPNDGKLLTMNCLLWSFLPIRNFARVHLYSNLYVPNAFSTVASFTEAAFTGYVARTLGLPTNLGIDGLGRDVVQWPQFVFTAGGGGLPAVVYGYWVDAFDPITSTRRVFYAVAFPTPQVLLAAGNTVKFVLSLANGQCP